MWKTFEQDEDKPMYNKVSNGNILGTFSYKPRDSQYTDIPTSIGWEYNSGNIISGYVESNNLVRFDRENTKIVGVIKYQNDHPSQSA